MSHVNIWLRLFPDVPSLAQFDFRFSHSQNKRNHKKTRFVETEKNYGHNSLRPKAKETTLSSRATKSKSLWHPKWFCQTKRTSTTRKYLSFCAWKTEWKTWWNFGSKLFKDLQQDMHAGQKQNNVVTHGTRVGLVHFCVAVRNHTQRSRQYEAEMLFERKIVVSCLFRKTWLTSWHVEKHVRVSIQREQEEMDCKQAAVLCDFLSEFLRQLVQWVRAAVRVGRRAIELLDPHCTRQCESQGLSLCIYPLRNMMAKLILRACRPQNHLSCGTDLFCARSTALGLLWFTFVLLGVNHRALDPNFRSLFLRELCFRIQWQEKHTRNWVYCSWVSLKRTGKLSGNRECPSTPDFSVACAHSETAVCLFRFLFCACNDGCVFVKLMCKVRPH